MKTALALIIKFVVTFAAAWIAFSIFGNIALYTVLIVAAISTVLNFLLGDLLILRYFGNVVATISEGIMGIVTAYLILQYSPVTLFSMGTIYAFGIMVAVAEIFFHMYLNKVRIVNTNKSDNVMFGGSKLNYNIETGNELYPYSNKPNSDKSDIK